MSRHRAHLIALSTVLLLAVGALDPSWASAAATIGKTSPVSGATAGCGGAGATRVQKSEGSGIPSYAVPAGGGVITSWSTQAGGNPNQDMRFKVFRATATANEYTVVGASADEPLTPGTMNTFPARIAVSAGDRIGFFSSYLQDCFDSAIGNGSEIRDTTTDTAPGSTSSYPNSIPNSWLDVSAQLEPDADRDGYGDETQDQCPTNAVTQGPCQVDLSVTKVADRPSANVGDDVAYTITVTNNSAASPAKSVSVHDALPANVSLVAVSPSQGSCSGSDCALGDLGNGSSTTVTVVVRTTGAGNATDTATVSSALGDPDLSNNSASASTIVTVPGQAPTTLDPFTGVALSSQVALLNSSGKVPILVGCPTGTPGRCVGTLLLKTSTKVRVLRAAAKKKILTLGKSSFTIQSSKTAKVFVKLSRAGKRLLLKRGKLGAIATVRAKDGLGTTKTRTANVTLKAKKKH